ncbi:hypothetical protein Tco_1517962 [Tanacetum coccineum]
MIIGPSVPSSSSRGGKRISVLGEKLCVIFCLATLSQDWTIRMANALSFPKVHTLGENFFGSFCEERKLIMLPLRPLLVPKASFSEILLLVTLLLLPWWKRLPSLMIRGYHLPPEERCGHSYHFIHRFWDFFMETFDKFRVCDSMPESGDPQALSCPFTSLLSSLYLLTKSSVDSPSRCLMLWSSMGSLMYFFS